MQSSRLSKALFVLALGLIVYMPLHVFIAQSASLMTGGIEFWKAAKDVLLFLLAPLILYLSYRRGLWQDKHFRAFLLLGVVYALLHGVFVLFDQNDDTYSAIVGTVYNTRLLGYLLLGYVVGVSKNGKRYLRYILTATVVIASLVAAFGVAQYFLPTDLLENVGYSLERGVKPLFFIDDRPDLPRVMSTLKDPNSLGAYLILPMLLAGWAFLKSSVNKKLFVRPFRKSTLVSMFALMSGALFFSFSRGAVLGLGIAILAAVLLSNSQKLLATLKKFWVPLLVLLLITSYSLFQARNTALVQDYVFHAATTSDDADPNEKRLLLYDQALEDIAEEPEGYGPGSAGLVAITNPQGGVLTENYYLQVGYEVGLLGLATFLAIIGTLIVLLRKIRNNKEHREVATILLASLAAYLFYSLLIHLWSNEAVALQWWLIAGVIFGVSINEAHRKHNKNNSY
jgi:hypothetical protein